jgi:NADH dehydrogenase
VTCLDLGDYGAVLTTGWDRKVEQFGPDVKALTRTINEQWIYPPTGSREALLVASDIDAPWPPET